MVNARVNAWKQASQGLDPNNTRAYQTALKTWAQKNFPSADPAVIDQAAASVTPTGWGSNSQQVQAITDIFNNHITNKQIGKPATPDFSKALMGQNAGYGKVTMNAPTGASMNIPKATPGAIVPGAKPTAPAAAPATATQTAANPFGQMAGTLKTYAPPEPTSTGGTLKQTATGQVHRASATNPNAQPQQATTPAATPAPQTANPFAGLGQPAGTFKGRQPKTQVAEPVAESRVDFGAMLWTKMRDSK